MTVTLTMPLWLAVPLAVTSLTPALLMIVAVAWAGDELRRKITNRRSWIRRHREHFSF